MSTVTLWRVETDRLCVVRDTLADWYFWQKATPYDLGGSAVSCQVHEDSLCEVYTLGGDVLLYRGRLGNVPVSKRSYLTEVRVLIEAASPPPPAGA